MHTALPFLLAMITAIVLLNMWAIKLKIAYPILLVIGGLCISFVPWLPTLRVDPNLIFFIFLPPLLFDASWAISFKEMKKWWRMIFSFAFLVVFFTALLVAVVANHYIPGFSIALGFLLGGIVSPPDAVSTGAITKFVKIPKSTSTILEGESLLNDASSLIIFRFALVAIGTGQFIWQEAITTFLWMILGGAGVGLLLAWGFVQVHKRLPTDAPSDIVLTFVGPYFMYWVAEQLHCSGVLAVVSGGLFMATKQLTFLGSSSRIKGSSVWESVVFILNGIVFLLIGLELPEIVEGLRAQGIPLRTAIGYGALVTGVLIGARIISAYAAMLATMIFRPSVASRFSKQRSIRFLVPMLLGWTGMRGVVSLAAALSIPVTLDSGEAFPQRDLILFITFVAILLTLVVQGLTLPYFINKIKQLGGFLMVEDETEEQTQKKIGLGLKQHVLQFLKEKYQNEPNSRAEVEHFLKMWEDWSKANRDSWVSEEIKTIFIEVLDEQRKYLVGLNKDPKMNEEIIRRQIYRIDLEEERLKVI